MIYNALPPAGTPAATSDYLIHWSGILQHDREQPPIISGKTLAIILIAVAAFGLYQFATHMAHFTFTVHKPEYEVYDSVADRIKPFGHVKLPGEELAPGELKVDEVPAAEPHPTVLSGPQVFNEACIVCHGNGIGGAPMLENREAWAPRIAQGKDTLYKHAIEGYTGSAGYMPPKGARLDLSDGEIHAAVDYMVSQVPK